MSDDELQRLLDEERARAASRERARIRNLDAQASEEATFVGTLRDLSAQRAPVGVHTRAGRAHHGIVTRVAADHCVLHGEGAWPVYLALDAIASVRPAPGMTVPDAGLGEATSDRTLAEALARIAPERPRVAVVTGDDHAALTGDLVAVGRDVLTIRLDAGRSETVHVRVPALAEVVVEPV